MRLKILEKKFTYAELEKVCARNGWRIPFRAELEEGGITPLEFPVFVADENKESGRCYIFDGYTMGDVTKEMHLCKAGVFKEHAAGLKYDTGKLRLGLIDPMFIKEVGKVLTYGAEKYAPNSWQNIENAEERYKDALLRHTMDYLCGEKTDSESGLDHLSHIAANIMFLMYFEKNKSVNA